MSHEQNRSTALYYLAHFVKTFLLEIGIADGQHLVNNQDLRIEMRCHREGKPHIHAAGVSFYSRLEESLYSREGHDFIKPGINFAAAHSQYRAVQIYVLPSGQIRMKACADLQQASDFAVQLNIAAARQSRKPAGDR